MYVRNTKEVKKVKINIPKLEIALARACKNERDLRSSISPQTLRRIRQGEEVKPATVGKLARALNVDVIELIKED